MRRYKILNGKLTSKHAIVEFSDSIIEVDRPMIDGSEIGDAWRDFASGASKRTMKVSVRGDKVHNLYGGYSNLFEGNLELKVDLILEDSPSKTWSGKALCDYDCFPDSGSQKMVTLTLLFSDDLTVKEDA